MEAARHAFDLEDQRLFGKAGADAASETQRAAAKDGGERWWSLARDAAKTDWLAKILEPKDTSTSKAKRSEVF